MINKELKIGKLSWDNQIKSNDSFLGHANDICIMLNIKRSELKAYWENSQFGLLYIKNHVKEHKRLP